MLIPRPERPKVSLSMELKGGGAIFAMRLDLISSLLARSRFERLPLVSPAC